MLAEFCWGLRRVAPLAVAGGPDSAIAAAVVAVACDLYESQRILPHPRLHVQCRRPLRQRHFGRCLAMEGFERSWPFLKLIL